jgi:16S rRNA (guanine966-N2)-methyltransferase
MLRRREVRIAVEDLGRGAEWADFVDQQRAACDVIRWNLDHTGLTNRSAVHQMPVPAFLRRSGQPYDLVILDPPYADPEIATVLGQLADSQLVESGTIVALGHWPKFASDDVTDSLRLVKRRCHGDSCFSIYEVARGVTPAQ